MALLQEFSLDIYYQMKYIYLQEYQDKATENTV